MANTALFEVRETDRCFIDSPDAGDPGCRCSRCGERIYHFAVRAFPKDGRSEYRYHPECLGMGAMQSTRIEGEIDDA